MTEAVFYQSVGPELTRYDIDVAGAALTKRDTVATPGAKVQYVWPHPSRQWLYVVSSDGGPGTIPGTKNVATAFRIDRSTGALTPHGETAVLPYRPVHCSVDRSGGFLLTAYNYPSHVTVHRINADGTLGAEVPQPEKLDLGIFAHQIRTTPGNRTAVLVTRGNDATTDKPEDPGALKVYRLRDGVLTNLASIAPGRGLGFGARHLDFHPTEPWVFVAIERQSQLHLYRLQPDGNLSREPAIVKTSLADPANIRQGQAAGAIHVHPNGRFVYLTNRNSNTVDSAGHQVFAGGENNIAVFAINQGTGEPTLIQNAEAHTNHLRTFSIDPTGRLLIAASIRPITLRDGTILPAALVLYRIGGDGKLSFARKYDVDTGRYMQFWTGVVTLA